MSAQGPYVSDPGVPDPGDSGEPTQVFVGSPSAGPGGGSGAGAQPPRGPGDIDGAWSGWQRVAVIVICAVIGVAVLLLVVFAFNGDEGATPTAPTLPSSSVAPTAPASAVAPTAPPSSAPTTTTSQPPATTTSEPAPTTT